MSLPPDFLANMVGRMLYAVHSDPSASQFGKGLGLIWDLARNTPNGYGASIPRVGVVPQQSQPPIPSPTPGTTPGA